MAKKEHFKSHHISSKHALTRQEAEFCKLVASGLNPTECYRRVYGEAINTKGEADKSLTTAKAQAELKRDVIINVLEEIGADPLQRAKGILKENMWFHDDPRVQQAAAKAVLDDAEKLGQRDSFEFWAEVMCAIGAEVVYDDGLVIPLHTYFPQYEGSVPPLDAIDKTIKSLEDYAAKRREQDEAGS